MVPAFLLFFQKRSSWSPACEGEFIKTPEFGDLHVYKGRYISREEFNAFGVSDETDHERYSEKVCFRCDLIAEREEDPEADPTDPTDPTDPEPDSLDESTKAELALELSELQNKQLVADKAESLGVIVNPADFNREDLEAEVLRLVFAS